MVKELALALQVTSKGKYSTAVESESLREAEIGSVSPSLRPPSVPVPLFIVLLWHLFMAAIMTTLMGAKTLPDLCGSYLYHTESLNSLHLAGILSKLAKMPSSNPGPFFFAVAHRWLSCSLLEEGRGGRQACNILWAGAKIGFDDVRVLSQLIKIVSTSEATLDAQQCSSALWAIATLNLSLPDISILDFEPLLKRCVQLSFTCSQNSQSASNSLWAMVRLKPEPLFVDPLVISVVRCSKSDEFLPRHAIMSLQSLALLGFSPESNQVLALCASTLRLSPKFNAQEVSNALWSVSSLGIQNEDLLKALLVSVQQLCPSFTPQNAANTLHSLASIFSRHQSESHNNAFKIELVCSKPFRVLLLRASDLLPVMSTQETVNSFWSLGMLGCYEFRDIFASFAAKQVLFFTAQHACMCLWASVRLFQKPYYIIPLLFHTVLRLAPSLSPLGYSTAVSCFASLGVKQCLELDTYFEGINHICSFSEKLEFSLAQLVHTFAALSATSCLGPNVLKLMQFISIQSPHVFSGEQVLSLIHSFTNLRFVIPLSFLERLESRFHELSLEECCLALWVFSCQIEEQTFLSLRKCFIEVVNRQWSLTTSKSISFQGAHQLLQSHYVSYGLFALDSVVISDCQAFISTFPVSSTSSHSSLQVASILKYIGFNVVLEFPLHPGTNVDMLARSVTCDVAVEFDGPTHFLFNARGIPEKLNGATMLRNKIIKRSHKLVTIAYYEWDCLNHEERVKWLSNCVSSSF